MDFEKTVLQFIKKNELMAPRSLVIVGLSGGADSMALLLALRKLRHILGIRLQAAHFNHKFRADAGEDERFVVRWCKQLNIPLSIGHRRGGKIKKLSEDDARQMRFEFFARTVQSLNAQSAALAHTRNDLAETVMMRLVRGSGLYGLRAILPSRSIEDVLFVRPLMNVSRVDVENYLKSLKIPYRTDKTNFNKVYERNRVRLDLLPLLAREYNPQIIKVLSDLAATSAVDYDFLSRVAHQQFEKTAVIAKRKVKINVNGLKGQHPAILRLIYRQMAETLTGNPSVLTFESIHVLENLLYGDNQTTIVLNNHLKAVKTQQYIELSC